MPKIRLNKAVKEFNISMSRLVEFLQSKGIEVESNPNAQLEESAYSALEAEFRKDSEQRKASHEVVIAKVPEEKLEIEPAQPEVIRAKASLRPETKILGKIDLEQRAQEVKGEKTAPEPVAEVKPAVEPAPVAEKQEFKVLDKIDLSQIEGNKPRSSKKDQPKTEEKPAEQPAPEKTAETTVAPAETSAPAAEAQKSGEAADPDHIETVYKKLDGPKILKQTVDLSQFNKPKPQGGAAGAKKKRKRIEKPYPTVTTQAGQGTGTRPPGQGGNRPPGQAGNNRPGTQGGNRPGYQGGGGANRGPARRGAVMPVELTDEQVKNQIKETLEKLTSKAGKNKGAKYRKEKRVYRREQDEPQEEMDAAHI